MTQIKVASVNEDSQLSEVDLREADLSLEFSEIISLLSKLVQASESIISRPCNQRMLEFLLQDVSLESKLFQIENYLIFLASLETKKNSLSTLINLETTVFPSFKHLGVSNTLEARVKALRLVLDYSYVSLCGLIIPRYMVIESIRQIVTGGVIFCHEMYQSSSNLIKSRNLLLLAVKTKEQPSIILGGNIFEKLKFAIPRGMLLLSAESELSWIVNNCVNQKVFMEINQASLPKLQGAIRQEVLDHITHQVQNN